MAEGVLPAPFAQNAVEPVSIWGIFGWIRQRVAGALISDRERKFLSLVEPAFEAVGSDLLAAEDLGDLEDRVEAAIELPDLSRLSATVLLDPELKQLIEDLAAAPKTKDWPVDLLG